MPSIVSHAWIPIKKDAPADALREFEKGGKVLATPGIVHAYQGISTDPNEPNHVELLAREFPTYTYLVCNRTNDGS